jgi:hypothetical protein
MAFSGLAALIKEGLFPSSFGHAGEWLTTTLDPFASSRLRFIKPCSSGKMRIAVVFCANHDASFSYQLFDTNKNQ